MKERGKNWGEEGKKQRKDKKEEIKREKLDGGKKEKKSYHSMN